MICVINMIDLVKDQNEKDLYDFIENNLKFLSLVNKNIKSFIKRNQSEVFDYIAKLNNSYKMRKLPFTLNFILKIMPSIQKDF